jgi:photosystem II stability/assembly factor-like uncharacterized protein
MQMIKKLSLSFIPAIIVSLILMFPFVEESNNKGEKEKKPNDWFMRQRAFPFQKINHEAYITALHQAKEMKTSAKARRDESVWELAGPVNTGGRLTDVEMHPADINIAYIGAASGGVFKSTDKGQTWEPIFDEALSLSIGDIALAPSNPDIIYVGTGEANAGGGSLAYDGVGIYRSDDAGETWAYLGLEESRNVGRMVVDPTDPETVYVAAMGSLFADSPDRGIFKTSDGGASWQKVLYISDSTGAIDVAIHPTNPDIVYAAMWERVRRPNRRSYGGATCGIFRSDDGGDTWEELTNGLPTLPDDKGRIGIDICTSEPDILYAIYADRVGYFNGVYRTDDGGDSWTRTNDNSLSQAYYSYGWWFGRIKVDPTDPDNAFVIGFDIYRTLNGGWSWTNQSGNNVHVDQHAVYIHPTDNSFILLGNDGGLYTSTNTGSSWSLNETLPITQFYTCEIDYQMPYRLYGGTQDNGTNRTTTGNLDDWETIYGGDGFYVIVDPTNNNYVYAEYQYGGLGRSTNGGNSFVNATSGISSNDRFNWNCPLVIDPGDPEVLYFGTNKLYKTTNRAVSWTPISGDLTDGATPGNLAYNTLTTISVSPVNSQIIYTGADDGNVHITADGGTTYTNISNGLPKRWITRVAADPVDEATAYVTVSGYRWDEFQPHVFKTADYGQNWTDISSNLPEAPVNDIIINPANNEILYVATDMGVYVTYDGGNTWSVLGSNLPNVVVCDLVYHQPTNMLVAGTYGRSMYTYDLEQDPITKVEGHEKGHEIIAFPNPFSNSVTIRITPGLELSGIHIFDITGSLVRNLDPMSTNPFQWDGCDDQGHKMPPGVYTVQVISDKGIVTKKVILK